MLHRCIGTKGFVNLAEVRSALGKSDDMVNHLAIVAKWHPETVVLATRSARLPKDRGEMKRRSSFDDVAQFLERLLREARGLQVAHRPAGIFVALQLLACRSVKPVGEIQRVECDIHDRAPGDGLGRQLVKMKVFPRG